MYGSDVCTRSGFFSFPLSPLPFSPPSLLPHPLLPLPPLQSKQVDLNKILLESLPKKKLVFLQGGTNIFYQGFLGRLWGMFLRVFLELLVLLCILGCCFLRFVGILRIIICIVLIICIWGLRRGWFFFFFLCYSFFFFYLFS